ncbi:MAG: cation transporter dimerization domain-containing protein [Dialister invisus]
MILETPGVYGVHDLIVHDYGPENHFASAHVELDSNLTLVEGHELAETVMTKLRTNSISRR